MQGRNDAGAPAWPPRRRRWVRALLAGAAAITAASALAEPCKLKQMEIPVRLVDGRPIATLKLNGTEMPMLVDSGAFYSMLSTSTANQLGLRLRPLPNMRIEGYTGKIVDVKYARVDKVGMIGAELPNIEFLVGGNELNAGIMGILGRNILSVGDTEYDLAHGVVRLGFPEGDCEKMGFAYWAGSAPVIEVPLASSRNTKDTAVRLHVAVNGIKALALMDTGAPATSITLATARRAGIKESDLTPYGRTGGAGEGRVAVWLGRVSTFEVGGEKIANNELRIDDIDYADQDLLLGLDYFLSHRIYVSREQRKVYITWNGGPVFARNRSAADAADTRYAAVPSEVAKDDADALARRGTAALASGNLPRALEDLNRACELAPGVADNFFQRARVHFAMRQWRVALADLDEALRLDPALNQARLRRAQLREGQGDRAGARADLAQLDATLPPGSNLRFDMGELYARTFQTAEALKQLGLWIDSHQRDARLANALAMRCWARTRQNIELPLALKDCKEAVDEDGADHSIRASLAWTYLRLGDAGRAKGAFDESIRLKETAWSLYGRGLAHLRLNDAAAGERDLAAARKLDPKVDEEVAKEGFEFAAALARPRVAGS